MMSELKIIKDLLENFRKSEGANRSINDNLNLILLNEKISQDQPFEEVGRAGRHTVVYDLGKGICARLHYSNAEITAKNDYDNHSLLISDGFPVPRLRSKLISDGRLAIFAVDLIDGQEGLGEGSSSQVKRDYEQIISIMQLAKKCGRYSSDWMVNGNTLRERGSGRLVLVDLTDWVKIDSLTTNRRESAIKEMDETILRFRGALANLR